VIESDDAVASSTSTVPPLAGLTSTVSVKLLPGQPASAGFVPNTDTAASGNTRVRTSQSRATFARLAVLVLLILEPPSGTLSKARF
jgi:hypothetical protein